MSLKDVTVIGLGLMGSALARALSAAGLRVTVWNRTIEKTKAFEIEAFQVAKTIGEAVQENWNCVYRSGVD